MSAETRAKVTAALSNDFDTPAALGHLNTLLSKASQYADLVDAGDESNLGPLRDSVEQVDSFFQTVGLHFSPAGAHPSAEQFSDGSGSGSTQSHREVTDEYVSFRSRVRAAALAGAKGREQSYQEILKECDFQRDVVASSLGIKIEDTYGEASTWRPM